MIFYRITRIKLLVYLYHLFACWTILSVYACADSQPNEKFTILTTTSMLGDAVANIVKEDAHVVSLMGPGIDPHTYQSTQNDIEQLMKADIIFYNGLYLEGKMTELLEKLAKYRKVYPASDALNESQLIFEDVFPIGIDPHIWFDVQLWKEAVCFISNKLQEARPDSAAIYQRNTEDYLHKLEVLHQEVLAAVETIPPKQRVLVTAHDAFGYFGKAYNIEVVGLQGISTIAECGLKDIQRMVQLITERKIKAVFFESSVSDRSMKAVLEGCSECDHQVQIGGCLYSDALGTAGTIEGTYCGMVRANTNTIVNALK